ncbi:MAG: hypothetical protein BWK79_05335 [Beggiatoa sp. IS2]|nr:MAG: hypothetical protein BWK79_05335 [Beggiatoa sp. IS2]
MIRNNMVKIGQYPADIHGTGPRGGWLFFQDGKWTEGADFGCNWIDGQGKFSQTRFDHTEMLVNKDGVYDSFRKWRSQAVFGLLSTYYKVEISQGLITRFVFKRDKDGLISEPEPTKQLPLPPTVSCYRRFAIPKGGILLTPKEYFSAI